MGGCAFVALLERERELALTAERLARAQAGAGSLLLVEGPPGIGKTALLDAIRPSAMARLSARADELEREFAYGVVRDLFEPALRRAGGTASLLDGAARFAAPVVGAGDGVAGSEASVLHGLYWLTSNLAEQTPLVLAVDDAHWADAASLRFLHYLARRLGELPVLLVVAVRTTDPAAAGELLTRLRATPGTQVVRLDALSEDGTAQLVRTLVSAAPRRLSAPPAGQPPEETRSCCASSATRSAPRR
jgi:hypothetical protein